MYDIDVNEMGNSERTDNVNRSIKEIAYDKYGNLTPYTNTLSHEWYTVETHYLNKPSEHGFFVIKGNTYEIKHDLFVEFKNPLHQLNGKLFPVYEVKKHNTRNTLLYYTIINDKKYIADMRYVDGSNVKLPCF
jgi:hypothetical protein